VIDLVGFDDRLTLRDVLSQVLAKSDDEKRAFADTFDSFFAFDQFKNRPASAVPPSDEEGDRHQADMDGGDGEAGESEEGTGGDSQQAGGCATAGGGAGGERQGEASASRMDVVSRLEGGDQAELQMALAEAAGQVSRHRSRLSARRGMFTRRIMEVMGLDGLNDEIDRRE